MKNILKKFLVVLSVLTMVVSLTACGKEKEVLEYNEAIVSMQAQRIVETVSKITSDEINAADLQAQTEAEQDFIAVFKTAKESWSKAEPELGEIVDMSQVDVNADDKNITAIVHITGEKKTAEVEIIFDKRMNPTSITTNVYRTTSENMTNAALNTLLGMGTVFVVLIFICILISLFKYIGEFEKNAKNKKQEASTSKAGIAADNAVAQIVQNEEAADDLELIAVISAAIAAYESANGGSSEGYQVRSIKRRA